MSERKFKKGDVVRFLSGGREMTVEVVNQDSRIDLVWFDAGGPERGVFYEWTLGKVERKNAEQTQS